MLSAIILDDEKPGRESLKALLLRYCPDITLVREASGVDEAKALIEASQPDVLFLDIELKNESGFNLLEQLDQVHFETIFTTAHQSYAFKAFKFSGLDYLLKPIDVEELVSAVNKALVKKDKESQKKQVELLLNHLSSDKPSSNTICLPTSDGVEFIKTRNILYCQAQGAYTRFVLSEGKALLVSRNLKEYETLLDNKEFMRVHNSYLINLIKVKKYVKSDGGYIVMTNGDEVNISQKNKEPFLEIMRSLR